VSGPPGNEGTRPWDAEAESCVVASLLIAPSLFADISRLVQAADFCSPTCQAAYVTIEKLSLAGRRADRVTVCEVLEREHAPPAGGWRAHLSVCAASVPSEAGAEEYARIVREKAVRRRWFDLGRTLQDEAAKLELPELLAVATNELVAVTGMALDRTLRSASEVADELVEVISTGVPSLPTGLRGLDDAIGGLGQGDLIVVAGRTSMGKSTLAQNIMEYSAAAGKGVLLFTLEMPARAVLARMVCARTHIPLQRLVSGSLTDAETARVIPALQELARLPIRFCDRPVLRLGDVLAESRRTKALHGLDLVVVDYLQLMQVESAERREREVAQLSAGLKRIAGELDLPVLCLSQLNRDVEKRKNKRPRLADLRDSGSIEQDADVVLMLYREWVYDRSVPPDKAAILVEKQRNGPPAEVPVRFLGQEFRFADAEGA
jgi:replicative DNA helicase